MLEWLKSLFADGESVRTQRELAERGENVAARFLRNLGYKIILRNYRNDVGEVDIIARDGRTLVFVEVKSRDSDRVAPDEQVGLQKRQQVVRGAKIYLSRYGTPQPAYRFDIVGIVWPAGRDPKIDHQPNA